MWSGERPTKNQATTRPENLWSEVWSKMGKAAQKKGKNGRTRRKNSTMLEDREAFISSIRKMVKKKRNHQNRNEKVGSSNGCGDDLQKSNKEVEAHESTRRRLESSLPKDHEDHIAEKGHYSMSHKSLVHKCVPMLHAMKFLDAKAAVDKERLPAWQITKV